MAWNIISLAGEIDNYEPKLSTSEPRNVVSFINKKDPRKMRNNVFELFNDVFGEVSTEKVADLLVLGMSVAAADIVISREFSKDFWTRDITIHLPVKNVEKWRNAKETMIDMLNFLSGDNWDIILRKRKTNDDLQQDIDFGDKPKIVSLFSGGLDSLAGAVDLLSSGDDVALVGHHGSGMTLPFQKQVFAGLDQKFPGQAKPFYFYVERPTIDGLKAEKTQRARSFLFLILGIAVASVLGEEVPLYVCENGFISLNVPLTPARSGSLTTRTTHPHFINMFKTFIKQLGLKNKIYLPYKFKTKGQMIKKTTNPEALAKTAGLSVSCAHPEQARYHRETPGTHCGYCFPCIIRRAAMHLAGLDNANDYLYDVLTEANKLKKGSVKDLRAISIAIERYKQLGNLEMVSKVISTGPIPPNDIKSYVKAYAEGMEEIETFLHSTK